MPSLLCGDEWGWCRRRAHEEKKTVVPGTPVRYFLKTHENGEFSGPRDTVPGRAKFLRKRQVLVIKRHGLMPGEVPTKRTRLERPPIRILESGGAGGYCGIPCL